MLIALASRLVSGIRKTTTAFGVLVFGAILGGLPHHTAFPQNLTRIATRTPSPDTATRIALHACETSFSKALGLAPSERHPTDASVAAIVQNYFGAIDSVPWTPVPAPAVKIGRACLRQLGIHGTSLGSVASSDDLLLLLHLAIGVEDDSLIHTIVTRQLAAAPSVRDRAHVLDGVIRSLLNNRWENGPQRNYRSPAKEKLVQHYAAQLDTMHPAGAVLITRFDVLYARNKAAREWNADQQLAYESEARRIAASIPFADIPAEDTGGISSILNGPQFTLARATYLKTPTHANLLAWLAALDSAVHAPPGSDTASPIAHPAGPIDGIWFNADDIGKHPVVPKPGAVTLLVFVDLLEGEDYSGSNLPLFEQIRRLRTRFPQLQIVLVTATHGQFRSEDYLGKPEQEAARLKEYFDTEVKLPVPVCVLPLGYRLDPQRAPGTPDPPMPPSPLLASYKLTPKLMLNSFSALYGFAFLVDQAGWVVDTDLDAMNGHLIKQLLAQGNSR